MARRRKQQVEDRVWQLEQQLLQLNRERADLSSILESLSEGVLAVDENGVVLQANSRAMQLLGIDEQQCVGSHLFVAVPNNEVCAAVEEVMRGIGIDHDDLDEIEPGRVFEIQSQLPERQLRVRVAPLRRSKAQFSGAIVVIRNVTKLRRLERARRDFFSNVSHELKTPLTAIRGSLETVIDDPQMDTPTRSNFLTGALRHTERLATLVRDLLTLSRLEHDPRMKSRAVFSIGALTDEVVASYHDRAQRSGVSLQYVPAIGNPDLLVRGDEETLRQAISNLVGNAFSHGGRGGEITVLLSEDGVFAELSVADVGPGIPPEAHERIFERFYRIDDARSREHGGSGIGLSIVKHVAQVHGGTVDVQSELGVGSIFRMRIPLAK